MDGILWAGKLLSGPAMTLEPTFVVALIAAAASIAVAIFTQLFSRQTQERLQTLSLRIDELSQRGKARIDYEYEARKRLYQEYEPVLFELVERSESALYRIYGLARTAREGNLEPGHGYLSKGEQFTDYYLLSTAYRLIAPLAIVNLLQRRLTLVDLRLDASISIQYELARRLYFSFADDFDLANRAPSLAYDPFAPGWWEKRIAEPAVYWRQGLPLGLIDNAVESLIVRDEDKIARPLTYGAFETAYAAKQSDIHRNFAPVVDLFEDFHPRTRPVLWRMLIVQAHFHLALMAIRGRGSSELKSPASAWEAICDPDRKHFDWRQEGERHSDNLDRAMAETFDVARHYLQDKLEQAGER